MKDHEAKKQMLAMGTSATLEMSMLAASFIRHIVEYPHQTGKYFVYLTNYKMLSLGVDSAVKIYKIKQALNIETLKEPLLPEAQPDPEVDGEAMIELPIPDLTPDLKEEQIEAKLEILRKPSWEIPTLNLVITVDLLYWTLDRTGGWPSYILHSLDMITLPVIYAAADTPVLSSPVLRRRFVPDHLLPFAELVIYAVFYFLYQGIGDGTNENSDPPYAVLDWHEKPDLTAIYSTVLPVVMPVLNAILLKILDRIQQKLHPNHEVKDYGGQHICIRIVNTVKNCLSSVISVCIWRRDNMQSPQPVNADASQGRGQGRGFC